MSSTPENHLLGPHGAKASKGAPELCPGQQESRPRSGAAPTPSLSSSTDTHTHQDALARLQAPQGALSVDLVRELPFHEDVLPILLQHSHPDGAAAQGHRDLEPSRRESLCWDSGARHIPEQNLAADHRGAGGKAVLGAHGHSGQRASHPPSSTGAARTLPTPSRECYWKFCFNMRNDDARKTAGFPRKSLLQRGDQCPWRKASMAGAGVGVPPIPILLSGPVSRTAPEDAQEGRTPTCLPGLQPRATVPSTLVLEKPSLSVPHPLTGDTCPGQSLPSSPSSVSTTTLGPAGTLAGSVQSS